MTKPVPIPDLLGGNRVPRGAVGVMLTKGEHDITVDAWADVMIRSPRYYGAGPSHVAIDTWFVECECALARHTMRVEHIRSHRG